MFFDYATAVSAFFVAIEPLIYYVYRKRHPHGARLRNLTRANARCVRGFGDGVGDFARPANGTAADPRRGRVPSRNRSHGLTIVSPPHEEQRYTVHCRGFFPA